MAEASLPPTRAPDRLTRRLWPLALAAVAIEAAVFLLATRRFLVQGTSMMPALKPGDRVVVAVQAYRLRRPRRGDVVVVRQRGSGGRLDVKRIAAGPGDEVEVAGRPRLLAADEWFVTGDNGLESTDSRHLGPVSTADLVGPVWFHY